MKNQKTPLTPEQYLAILHMNHLKVVDALTSLVLDTQLGNTVPKYLWDKLIGMCVEQGEWRVLEKIYKHLKNDFIQRQKVLQCAKKACYYGKPLDAIGAYAFLGISMPVNTIEYSIRMGYSFHNLSAKDFIKSYELIGLDADMDFLKSEFVQAKKSFNYVKYVELCSVFKKKPNKDFIKKCLLSRDGCTYSRFMDETVKFNFTASKNFLIVLAQNAYSKEDKKSAKKFLELAYQKV